MLRTTQNQRLRLLVLAHTNRSAGSRSVAVNLLRALASTDNGLEITAVLPVRCGYEETATCASLAPVWFDQKGSFFRRLLFDNITLRRMIRAMHPDVILALGSIGVRNPCVPQAILVQDAHFVYPRRQYGRMTVLQHMRYFLQKRQLRECLSESSVVYCQTPTMLRRVKQVYGEHGHLRVLGKTVSHAVSAALGDTACPSDLAPFPDRFRLICLTRYYPHKNLEGIVETFRLAREQLKGVVVFLTIAATQHRNAGRLLADIDRLGLGDQIVNVGPLEQRDIPAYFKHCHGLLFPTKMESFSATYLEAMHLDLPILTSDLDFAREVCGEAALYFDPWSHDSMAKAIVRLRDDAGLRDQLAGAGRRQIATAHNRSWKDVAQLIVSDLQGIVRGAASVKT